MDLPLSIFSSILSELRLENRPSHHWQRFSRENTDAIFLALPSDQKLGNQNPTFCAFCLGIYNPQINLSESSSQRHCRVNYLFTIMSTPNPLNNANSAAAPEILS